MSNNMYDILKKMQNLEQPKATLTEGKKVCKDCGKAKCQCVTESKGSKPDYLDMDKDGNKEEPMKKAVKDKEKGAIAEAVAIVESALMEKYMGFKKTVAAIKKGGSAENPEAVAAAIGRKKYGKAKFQKAAAAGKKLGEGAVSPKAVLQQIQALVDQLGQQQGMDTFEDEYHLIEWLGDLGEEDLISDLYELPEPTQMKVVKALNKHIMQSFGGQSDYADARGSLGEGQFGENFSKDEVDAAVQDFVRGGGEVQKGKPSRGPRKPGMALASKHIGGGGDKMKASRTGRGSNPQGKAVVAAEGDMEEGNKFTGNLMKARAQGLKQADLDGDGDMEKVHEGWDDMQAYLKKKNKDSESKGGAGVKAGKRYGGAAQHDDDSDTDTKAADAPKTRGRPKKDKFAR